MKKTLLVLPIFAIALTFASCNKSGVAPKPDLPTSNKPGTGGIIGTISPNIPATVVALGDEFKDSITSTPVKGANGSFVLSNLAPGRYDIKIIPASGSYKVSTFGVLLISSGGFTDAGSISLGH